MARETLGRSSLRRAGAESYRQQETAPRVRRCENGQLTEQMPIPLLSPPLSNLTLNHALRCCSNLLIITDGSLCACGASQQIITAELLSDIYHLAGRIE